MFFHSSVRNYILAAKERGQRSAKKTKQIKNYLLTMDTYEKILLASLGLLGFSAKEVQKAFKTIAGKKPSKKELKKTLSALIKEGQSRQKGAEKKARELVKKVLKELDIPTRSELKSFERKLSNHGKN